MKNFSLDLAKYMGFINNLAEPLQEEVVVENPNLESEATLKKYKEFLDSGEIFEIAFSQQEWDLGLWKKENGVEIVLLNEELGEGNTYHVKIGALTRIYSVIVYKIEGNKVYVSLKRAQEKVRPIVLDKINESLRKKEPFIAPAKVVYISNPNTGKRFCLLDIMGLGIRGIMRVVDWGHEYVSDLRTVTKVGDTIPVALVGTSNNHTSESPQYQCSRKETMPAPVSTKDWSTVETEFPLNTRVAVKCLKRYDKSFLGSILGRDWVVYCLYPDAEKYPGVNVLEGGCYRGYVSHVNAEKHVLRIRIIEQIPEKVAELI